VFARGPSPARLTWLDYLVSWLPGVAMDISRIDLAHLEVGDVLRYSSRVRGIEDPRTLPTAKLPGLLVLCQKLLGYDVSSCVLDAHCSPARLARCLLCRTRRWFNKERNEYTQAFRKVLKQKKCASARAMVRARCTAHDRRCCGWQMWSANCGRRKQNARHHMQKCLPFGHGCRKCRLVFVALWWLSFSHPCCTRTSRLP